MKTEANLELHFVDDAPLVQRPFNTPPLRVNLGLHRCKIAITTGAPIGADCFHFWKALGIGLKEVYTSTEADFLMKMDTRIWTVDDKAHA